MGVYMGQKQTRRRFLGGLSGLSVAALSGCTEAVGQASDSLSDKPNYKMGELVTSEFVLPTGYSVRPTAFLATPRLRATTVQEEPKVGDFTELDAGDGNEFWLIEVEMMQVDGGNPPPRIDQWLVEAWMWNRGSSSDYYGKVLPLNSNRAEAYSYYLTPDDSEWDADSDKSLSLITGKEAYSPELTAEELTIYDPEDRIEGSVWIAVKVDQRANQPYLKYYSKSTAEQWAEASGDEYTARWILHEDGVSCFPNQPLLAKKCKDSK